MPNPSSPWSRAPAAAAPSSESCPVGMREGALRIGASQPPRHFVARRPRHPALRRARPGPRCSAMASTPGQDVRRRLKAVRALGTVPPSARRCRLAAPPCGCRPAAAALRGPWRRRPAPDSSRSLKPITSGRAAPARVTPIVSSRTSLARRCTASRHVAPSRCAR